MSNYYVMIDGKQQGPFSVSEIKSMNLNPSTYVFTNGYSAWKKLSDVTELNYSGPTPVNTQKNPDPTVNPPVSQKKGMFQNPFSFEGRIRRLEYGLSIIIMYVFIFCIALFIGIIGAAESSEGLLYLLLIPAYWFMLAQGAKRCHDRDNSGWYQVIPLYGLWMLFAEGDGGSNQYGFNPK